MALVKLGSKAVGSAVKLNEDGTPVEFYVAKQDYEPELNGSGRVLLVRKECLGPQTWSSSCINAYANSTIDAWLNATYKNLLDDAIQMKMGVTKFDYTPGNGNDGVRTLERVVFLLSLIEMGIHYGAYDGMRIEGEALPSEIIRLIQDKWQWTRSPKMNTNDIAWMVYDNQASAEAYNRCNGSAYFRTALTLPADLWVGDDGSVVTNTAPTMPSSITVPGQINGGSTVTISWGTSTDGEDNLEGYKAERSVDGGSTWTQIYQGSSTSATNTVPFGTESVMYRVKAYDAEGLESGWKTSGQVTVINNTAPTVPGFITVPEQVQGGQPLEVSWGASSDGENNLAGYSLERQEDGGGWEAVYSGDQLSFTDQITKGWLSVAYRVRAFDTASAYSGFAVSETREVNNNTPPAITCEHPANADLGVKSEGFEIPYSVSDEEGDGVTVTELVDGGTLRIFAVELGAANSFQLTGTDFMKLLNGRHTLSITAADSASSAAHSVSFTKSVTAASVTLAAPMEADGAITVCVLSVSGFIPADADFTVKVTNNALDEAPVWEDCTAAVKAGGNHVFENETAANGFAFNFRLNVSRGTGGAGGYITSVQGGFQ